MNTRESLVYSAGLAVLVALCCILFFPLLLVMVVVDVIKNAKRHDEFISSHDLRRHSITPDIRDFKGKNR